MFLSILLRGARPAYIVLTNATKKRSVRPLWMRKQQQRINEAAQRFADALVRSFKAVSERTVASQEQGALLTQDFFNRVIENLRAQADDTRQMTQQLADQQQRAAEARQILTGASVDAYMDFVNSMFTFYQGSVEATQKGAREVER